MINEYFISTGSVFLSGAFASLLYPPKQTDISKEELENKVKLAIDLVNSKKIVNAPLLIENLNCDVKTANRIITILIERGHISLLE